EDAIDESAAHVELARQRAASGVGPTPEQLQVNEVVLGQGFVERRRNYIDNLREGRLASHLIVARKP
ncbi:MAG: methyltransferase type 11, partial [Microvirga sp.]